MSVALQNLVDWVHTSVLLYGCSYSTYLMISCSSNNHTHKKNQEILSEDNCNFKDLYVVTVGEIELE